jgi:hypothetical protein
MRSADFVSTPASYRYRSKHQLLLIVRWIYKRKPDVVQIAIEPDKLPTAITHPMDAVSALHLDNSHTIEIMIGNTSVGISNQASPELVHEVITSLKEISC